MSKQNKVEEEKVVTMEELEQTELAEVDGEEEIVEEESKIKKLWGKIKKPLIIGGAAIGGFLLGKALSGNDDDYVVYDIDPDSEDETDENETE